MALFIAGPALWLLGESGPVVALELAGSLALIVRQSSDWQRDYEGERGSDWCAKSSKPWYNVSGERRERKR